MGRPWIESHTAAAICTRRLSRSTDRCRVAKGYGTAADEGELYGIAEFQDVVILANGADGATQEGLARLGIRSDGIDDAVSTQAKRLQERWMVAWMLRFGGESLAVLPRTDCPLRAVS
jgi:hypothetical protein